MTTPERLRTLSISLSLVILALGFSALGFIPLNAGNIAAVAHALKQVRYYTAGEADYARAMTRKKAGIDRVLGPSREDEARARN
jgi:hypothetical protein